MTDTDFSFDNNLYICKVTADKKKCPTYLRSIPAVAQLFDRGIGFKKRITVFMGENGIGKHCLKLSPQHTGLTPRAEQGIFHFPPITPTRSCTAP